jgi:hypothetical protein
MARVCNTAGAAVARLTTGAASIAAHLTVGTAGARDTGSTPGAADSTAADTGVAAAAGISVGAVAIGATLAAGPTAAVLTGGTAGCSRGTVAVAAGVSHTADRRRRLTPTLNTKSSAVGGITGACACGWCVGTKDLCAPL